MTPANHSVRERQAVTLYRDGKLSAECIADRLHISLLDLMKAVEDEKTRRTISPHGLKVIRLYALGNDVTEISEELGTTRKSVDGHLWHIRSRLGIPRRQFVQFAILAGLIQPEEGLPPRAVEVAQEIRGKGGTE